jgi:DNA-binding response OmpR family regulator
MRVAIIDDDETARGFIADLMTGKGHLCVQFPNGRAGMSGLQRDTFDLLFVDWNMPGMTGIELMRWARESLDPCPAIIMMTSRSDKGDVIEGLEAGADDFIVKPERGDVVDARVEALMRRTAPKAVASRIEDFGDYAFDNLNSSVAFRGEVAELTAKEFTLAKLFFDNLHRPLSRAYLLETVWNSVADLPTRTLDVHVSKVRAKLQLRPENGYRLQTVFGFGYRLESYDDNE